MFPHAWADTRIYRPPAQVRLRPVRHDRALELGTVDPKIDHQSAQQTVAGDRERASRRPFFNFALVEGGINRLTETTRD
jgi:hypothetical protein